jgi:Secretion system C-terminal sorting domain
MKRILIFLFGFYIFLQNGYAQLVYNGGVKSFSFDATEAGVSNGIWNGSGLQSTPSSGQLDSDAWAVTGWSNGNLLFGGTQITTNTDYTRGTTTGGVTTGGFYARTTTNSLWIQIGGSDFEPGTITLKAQNTLILPLSSIKISYDILSLNDQGRGSTFNFSYSSDDVTYNAVSALDFTTPTTLDALGVQSVTKSTSIAFSPVIANNGFFYIRWSSSANGGTGSRDEIGLDNIVLSEPVLPIELNTLKIKSNVNSNKLSWQTATEKNNAKFNIERSENGETFSKIGEVKGKGTSNVEQNYSFTDATPIKGINYYRLRQVDFDGSESVSKTVSINFDGKGQNKVKAFPSPTHDLVNVELNGEGKSEISVRDMTGRVVLTQNTEGVTLISLNLANLSSGLYIMCVRSNEVTESIKIQKY